MASIKQINKRKFKITVSNGYHPDGRKISKAKTITVPNNIRKTNIRLYVYHAAEEMERYIKEGFGEDSSMTFEEYAERWLERQIKYAPSTIATYRRMLERVYPFIGTIPLNRLRPLALENMLIELRKRKAFGKTIQEDTVQKYLYAVSAVLSDAKRNEIIRNNPARMIDLPAAKKKEQVIPTEEEMERLILALQNEPLHYRIYYLLAICTGCRRGELSALKWTDFAFEDDNSFEVVMTISRSRSIVVGRGVIEGKTKNGKERKICMDENMGATLMAYRTKKEQEAQKGRFKINEYLFTDAAGKLVHPDSFTKHLREFFKKHGFPPTFHLHTLRHYFVSTLLHHGVDRQTVAELAGHTDTSFLEKTYCHPQLALKKEAASIMANTLFRQISDEDA